MLFRPVHYDQQASKQGAGHTHAGASVLLWSVKWENEECNYIYMCTNEGEVIIIMFL